MGRYTGKSCRIVSMLLLTTTFLLVEIIVGHMANSLALIADAFHMLSDTVALVVGLVAVQLSRRASSSSNTYGWARAEIVGALINAVFLAALCFTIFVEAVERLAMREPIDDARLLLYVGGIGLGINLLGLCLFHDHAHGHSHGGMPHGHSHAGGHAHNHSDHHSHELPLKHSHTGCIRDDHAKRNESNGLLIVNESNDSKVSDFSTSSNSEDADENPLDTQNGKSLLATGAQQDSKPVQSHQLNMRGVFIHVLGDALGSVVVMISAGLTLIARKYLDECTDVATSLVNATANISDTGQEECVYKDPDWVLCIDPILSLVLVAIILCTSLPLLRQAALVLMQSVPAHVEVSQMKTTIEQMEGVTDVHEFHVWSLAGNKVVASLHVQTGTLDEYIQIAGEIKQYLHLEGIHSVTIQPEFSTRQERKAGRLCVLECGPELDCHSDTCCGSKYNQIKTHSDGNDLQLESNLRQRNLSTADATV